MNGTGHVVGKFDQSDPIASASNRGGAEDYRPIDESGFICFIRCYS